MNPLGDFDFTSLTKPDFGGATIIGRSDSNSLTKDFDHLIATSVLPKQHQIFKFSHFNSLQSQLFALCYQTSESFVVNAPMSSGKTALA